MKTIFIIIAVFGFITLFTLPNQLNAQTNYGGSAYVYVKDKSTGEISVKNVTLGCVYDNKSEAKGRLKYQLGGGYNVEFTSQIYYDIDYCMNDDNYRYGGSASVKVKDTGTGEINVKNAAIDCVYDTKSQAKDRLRYQLDGGYNIIMISPISYEIDSCF